MSRNKKIEWVKAKKEFISDYKISLKEIAKKYGASYGWLRQVAMKENWIKEKEIKWNRAEEKALKKVEGSMEDLIIRHAKVARFLQASGLKYLKLLLDEVEDLMQAGDTEGARKKLHSLIYNKIISDTTLRGMVGEGLKAERELYPKQLEVKGGIELDASGISEELTESIYDVFRKQIGRKRPSIHKKTSRSKGSVKNK